MFIKEDKYYKVKGRFLEIILELVNLYRDVTPIDTERRDFLIGQLANQFWYMDIEEV